MRDSRSPRSSRSSRSPRRPARGRPRTQPQVRRGGQASAAIPTGDLAVAAGVVVVVIAALVRGHSQHVGRRSSLRATTTGATTTAIVLGATAVVILALVIWAAVATWRRKSSKGSSSSAQRIRQPTAAGRSEGWATAADLEPLARARPTGDAVVLGRGLAGGFLSPRRRPRLIVAEPRQSVLVVGPSQSGKTSGLAIPALLEWEGPVLATSVKADLLNDSLAARQARGDTAVFDPTGSLEVAHGGSLPGGLGGGGRGVGDLGGRREVGGEGGDRGEVGASPGGNAGVITGWSPVDAADTWQGARRIAAALCSIGRSGRSGAGGLEDAGFWYASAERLLAPLLRAASVTGGGMSDVVRWLDEESPSEVLLALQLADESDASRVARAYFDMDDRQRMSVFATASTVVAAYAEPAVAASGQRTPRLSATWLLDGGTAPRTLYCSAPARDQERLAPVFTALVREVLDAAFDRAARQGTPLDPPLLVLLDEAANVAPIADLDRVLATAAGHGISLVTIWQDLAQVESRYGTSWATVVNNHRAKVILPGIADPRTLELLSSLVGDAEREERSRTVAKDGAWSETAGIGRVPVAPSGWIRRLPNGHAMLVYGTLPPALVRLRPWFET